MYINSPEFAGLLQQFAHGSEYKREEVLPGIVNQIDNQPFQPYIEFTPEGPAVSQSLNETIKEVLLAGYAETDQDQIQQIFTGEAAVVIISNEGKVLTQYENRFAANGHLGRVHLDYGVGPESTLLPYAYKKGIQRLHLELSQRRGGIVARENYDYLASLLPEGSHIYAGDGVYNRSANNFFGSGSIVIGVSGAQIRPEFLEKLTGGAVKDETVGIFAGLMDTLATESIAFKLRNPSVLVLPIPPKVGDLFRAH